MCGLTILLMLLIEYKHADNTMNDNESNVLRNMFIKFELILRF